MNKQIDSIPADTMRALTQWHWPGNIRELENFIERAVILSRGSVLNVPVSELQVPGQPLMPVTAPTPAPARTSTPPPSPSRSPVGEARDSKTQTLEDKEREHILNVLRETKGVLSGADGAAARLGLKRSTLQGKMKKLGIDRAAI